jgi:peptidoglycan hydrolase CwlO-like protein
MCGHPAARRLSAPLGQTLNSGVLWVSTNPMLNTHKRAMSEIKSAHQRVKKAQEECDKLKEKLKKAQARLATEKRRLNASEQALES